MKPKILFYMQHLLGIGHAVRASRIASALAREVFDVDLVCGGPLIAGLDSGRAKIIALPPVSAGALGFSDLVDAQGLALTPAAKTARCALLLAHFERQKPDIVLIEAFPFGRRQMRFELLPLLEHARNAYPRPLIASSVRDILQAGQRPGRAESYAELVERFFDLVLVHGDPALADFAASFALADRISGWIKYTGMIGPEAMAAHHTHDVIVSAGGGAVGEKLIRAGLAARPLSRLHAASWLVVTGPNVSGGLAAELAQIQNPAIGIARFLADLPQRLGGAKLSISQAGYNTVADLLAARCRAVLVPYAAQGETEQSQRAALMGARGLASVIAEDGLDAAGMARAIDLALDLPERRLDIDMDGAQRSVTLLQEALQAHRN